MTDQEFNEWVRYHGDCVGGFTEWLAKGRDYTERTNVLRRWQEALSDVSLEDAKIASMAIMRGDIDAPAFGNHPKAIRQHAKAARSSRLKRDQKFINGQATYACKLCRDGGLVICYHPEAIRSVIRKRVECVKIAEPRSKDHSPRRHMPDMRTCAYACTCDEGQLKVDRGVTVYDEERCLRVLATTHEQQIDELFDEVNKRRTVKRHNYTPSFADFNSGGVAAVNKEIGF